MCYEPNTFQVNEAHRKDILRDAEGRRLARMATINRPLPSLTDAVLNHIGSALVIVGSRMKARSQSVPVPRTEIVVQT